MNKIIVASIFAVVTMGCGTVSSVYSVSTPTTQSYEDYTRQVENPCDELPAHITRGQRPIVIDGVTYYCF